MTQQSQQSPMNSLLSLPGFSDDEDDAGDQTGFSRPSPPWWRGRGTIIAALLLLVILGGVAFALLRNRKQPTTYEYQKVTRGDFSLTVNATGPLQSGVYNVVFSGSGTIAEIDVKVGQTVKQGQVLAKLDKTSLQDALNGAQATLLGAQGTLSNAQSSLSAAEAQGQANVAAAETALKNAQANLNTTESQAQADIKAAETAVNNALASLTGAQAQGQANVAAAQTTLNVAQKSLNETRLESQASVAAAQTTLQDAQANLGKVRAESQTSIASAQKAVSDVQTNLSKVQAQAQASIAVAYDQEQQAINACNTGTTSTGATPTPTPTPTPDCVQLAQNQYNQAVATAHANVATAQAQVSTDQKQLASMQAQAAANDTSAQGQVNTAQSQYNQAVATANANIATVQGQISTDQKQVNTAIATANANDTTAQGQVNTSQSAYTTALATANSDNTTAQGQINTAESQVNTAIATANANNATAQGQVNTAQSQFNTAETQVQTAQHNLNNATLTAPHDGIVTLINGTVGGTPGVPPNSSSSTTPSGAGSTFIQIVDLSSLQVQADVNESDAGNLKVGEPAEFTVSAFGDRLFRGTVSAISPNGQTVSNVVTYPVLIDVDQNSLRGATLLPGMTANVTIVVAQRSNVLLIPVNAVNFARTASRSSNGTPALISQSLAASAMSQARQMLNQLQIENPNISMDNPIPAFVLEPVGNQQAGNQFAVKPVVLGLTDDTVYEVLAGLSEGETIVVGAQRG